MKRFLFFVLLGLSELLLIFLAGFCLFGAALSFSGKFYGASGPPPLWEQILTGSICSLLAVASAVGCRAVAKYIRENE